MPFKSNTEETLTFRNGVNRAYSGSPRILPYTSHKGYRHANKGCCTDEHEQQDNRSSVGDSVSSALTGGKTKVLFVDNPGKWPREQEYAGTSWEAWEPQSL